MMRGIVFLALASALSACGTMNYIGIETYNPAEVTFPEGVAKVLVVNNAVPQPADAGYTYLLGGESQDTCRARADSALFDACRSLGEAMVDASYFDDVLLYHDATRSDKEAADARQLAPERVRTLCAETGADAVISLDRLLFDMRREVGSLGEGFLIGTIDVRMAGVIRGYLPDREAPLATIHVSDSLLWAESADYLPLLDKILPSPDEALRAAGEYIGAKAYINFVPHWDKETRWYFTGAGARWKEAAAYAAEQKWSQAEEWWNRLFNNSRGDKARAKAASNLALCHEMKGELREAYEWAHKSYELFKHAEGDKGQNAKLLELYVHTLAERVRSDKKLDTQFGED